MASLSGISLTKDVCGRVQPTVGGATPVTVVKNGIRKQAEKVSKQCPSTASAPFLPPGARPTEAGIGTRSGGIVTNLSVCFREDGGLI